MHGRIHLEMIEETVKFGQLYEMPLWDREGKPYLRPKFPEVQLIINLPGQP